MAAGVETAASTPAWATSKSTAPMKVKSSTPELKLKSFKPLTSKSSRLVLKLPSSRPPALEEKKSTAEDQYFDNVIAQNVVVWMKECEGQMR